MTLPPMARANRAVYLHWLAGEQLIEHAEFPWTWSVDVAAALLAGYEPGTAADGQREADDPGLRDVRRVREMILKAFRRGDLAGIDAGGEWGATRATPAAYVAWAEAIGLPIPEEWPRESLAGESPGERLERLLQRAAVLETSLGRGWRKTLAAEEGISVPRLGQLLAKARRTR